MINPKDNLRNHMLNLGALGYCWKYSNFILFLSLEIKNVGDF